MHNNPAAPRRERTRCRAFRCRYRAAGSACAAAVGDFLLLSVATAVGDGRAILRWSMCVSGELADDARGRTLIHVIHKE